MAVCLSALAGRVSGRGVSSAHLRKRSPSASTRASRRLGNCRQRPRKLHVSLMPRTSRRMRTANSRGRTCETPVNPQAAAVNRIISWADPPMKLKRLTRACGVLTVEHACVLALPGLDPGGGIQGGDPRGIRGDPQVSCGDPSTEGGRKVPYCVSARGDPPSPSSTIIILKREKAMCSGVCVQGTRGVAASPLAEDFSRILPWLCVLPWRCVCLRLRDACPVGG